MNQFPAPENNIGEEFPILVENLQVNLINDVEIENDP